MVSTCKIRLENAVIKRKGKPILGPISCSVGHTPCFAILGPVGAGKTTLLSTLYGMEYMTSGQRIASHANISQSFVFQRPIMLRRRVWENVAYPLCIKGDSTRSAAHKAHSELARYGLAEFASAPAQTLSGGQQQKLALLRALITNPDLLFLDEPTTSMDERTTREIETILQSAMTSGTRLILATHNIAQARRLSSGGLFLNLGTLHEIGENTTWLDHPRTDKLAAFLAGEPVL